MSWESCPVTIPVIRLVQTPLTQLHNKRDNKALAQAGNIFSLSSYFCVENPILAKNLWVWFKLQYWWSVDFLDDGGRGCGQTKPQSALPLLLAAQMWEILFPATLKYWKGQTNWNLPLLYLSLKFKIPLEHLRELTTEGKQNAWYFSGGYMTDVHSSSFRIQIFCFSAMTVCF